MISGALLSQAIGVFGTGVLASLSPCVYPMLPITLGFLSGQADGKGGKSNVWMYAAGQSIALFLVGIIAVQLGETLGFSSQDPIINGAIGGFLILAGILSWKGRLPAFFSRWNTVSGKIGNSKKKGPLAAFLLGVSAALVASPCTSPILGGVLALMATAGTASQGMFLMAMYALGFTLIFVIIGLGVLKMNKLPRAGAWMTRVHKLSSLVLVVAGVYFIRQVWVA